MDTGFGQNLEGFLIKGNLSLIPSAIPSLQGDGSIEGSGTLYIDTIREYNVDNGIDLQNVTFKNEIISVPYTAPSINATSASFVLSGGISINNTTNATSYTSGGALTVAGGASIRKKLEMGGVINMNNNSIINVPLPIDGGDAVNKDYVDFVSTKISGDFKKYDVIFGDSDTGDLIKGSSLFTFDETKLNLATPLIINDTTNATDINSTVGSLVVNGGAIIRQELQLGDNLNLNMNNITNVLDPVNNQDVATKKYVDDRKLQGSFTTGQVIIAASNGDEIRGYPSFTYNGTQLTIYSTENISGSNGGTFLNYGGSVILKDLFVAGKIILDDDIITGVAEPINNSDVATKYYVDSKTYGNLLGAIGENQLVVGTSTEGQLQSFPSFTFDGNVLLLNTSASFLILNTENAIGLGSGGSFTTLGGASFNKDLYVGGQIFMNDKVIAGVAEPTNDSDVATKYYVDSKTYGNLLGSLGANEVVVGTTTEGTLASFPSFTYNGTTLELSTIGNFSIKNTTNADGLGTGGTFTTLGGASFEKDVYIGGELDVNVKNIRNVQDPVLDLDAVNKRYVDDIVGSISLNVGGNTFTLNQNVTIAEDIPNFYYTSTVRAFISTVFVRYNNLRSANFTLYGINCGDSWFLNSNFVGENTGVHFFIRKAGTQGIIQYTNENVSGVTSIKFRTVTQIDDLASSAQYNYTLLNSASPLLLDIPELTFLNSELDSVKVFLYLTSPIEDDCALFLLNCVQHDGIWKMNYSAIDNGNNGNSDINFSIISDGTTGKIYYLNNNVSTDYTVRIKQSKILKTQNTITLNANTSVSTLINTNDLTYPLSDNSLQLTVYVFNTLDNKYALYEIRGVVTNGEWVINYKFIGDNLGVKFYIENIGDNGKLAYTNNNNNNAYIRYSKLAPITIEPLPVNKGGTGTDYLLPYGVLRGDGTNPVIATEDFIYKNKELILGNESSILLKNTQTATSLTDGGTLTSYGGASFMKDVFIGGELDVNVKNIRNVADPVLDLDAVNKKYVDNIIDNLNTTGITFSLNSNVLTPTDIPGFRFSENIKAFISTIFVEYNDLTSAVFTLYGISTSSNWILNSNFIGNDTGVKFFIRKADTEGILQYTNENISGITVIKSRTLTKIDNLASSGQYNYTLLNSATPLLLNIPELTFLNSELDSVKVSLYLSSTTEDDYALFLLNCVQHDGVWKMNYSSIDNGNNGSSDIKFSIISDGTTGKIYYLNNNVSTDYTVRIKQSKVFKTQNTIILNANTSVPTLIYTNDLTYPLNDNTFQLTLYVFNTVDEKYALYEILGVVTNNNWIINYKFIGDNLGVKFYIEQIGDDGKLAYTNNNNNNAYIRYNKIAPLTINPLSVNRGGTGTDYLLPYGVLRGDGTNPVIATEDFIYKDKELILGNESGILLKNTQTATSLTEGGTLTSYGGASFMKDVFIGGELDVNLKNIRNVADPIIDFDAVNKRYVDKEISKIDLTSSVNDNRIENTFTLDNNVLTSKDIPGFKFPPDIKAFISNIYIEIDGNECALYTIHGLNCGSTWTISTIFTGQQTSINFNIRVENGYGIMQYTNHNQEGTSYIRFRTITQVEDLETSEQLNLSLNANQLVSTRINELEFENSQYDSVKLIIYVASEIDNRYGLYLSNCVLKGNEWVMHTHSTGNVQGIQFNIENVLSPTAKGIINYRNTNSVNDYTIRVKQIKIESSQEEFILDPNTSDPTIINDEKLAFVNTDTYFQISVFVNVPALNKYALFEIRGVICEGIWNINTRYIGDYTGVRFYIYSAADGTGYLTYTNSNSTLANIRFIKNAPLASLKPLQINKGGTGSSYLTPNAVLRGNGTDPVIGTSDFIYENNKLILGNISSIILNSTSAAINLTTGGTLTSYGGMSVNKELLVGKRLIVKEKDITPNVDDICAEQSFNANNNQITGAPIVGFIFSSVTTKAFTSMATITVTTIYEIYDSLFEIKGLKKSSGWILYTNSVGDDTGVAFSIDHATGQIYYTSSNHTDWISTKIKFRAITTTT